MLKESQYLKLYAFVICLMIALNFLISALSFFFVTNFIESGEISPQRAYQIAAATRMLFFVLGVLAFYPLFRRVVGRICTSGPKPPPPHS